MRARVAMRARRNAVIGSMVVGLGAGLMDGELLWFLVLLYGLC